MLRFCEKRPHVQEAAGTREYQWASPGTSIIGIGCPVNRSHLRGRSGPHLEQVLPAAPERCQPGDKLRQHLPHLGVHGAPIKGMVAEGAMGGWGGGKEGERVTKLSTLRENGRGCTGWGSCQSDVGRHESHQNASPARQNQREDG